MPRAAAFWLRRRGWDLHPCRGAARIGSHDCIAAARIGGPGKPVSLHDIRSDIMPTSKELRFLGNSLDALRAFPAGPRQDAGFQLDKLQRGERPDDFKAMPAIGKGAEEIRIWTQEGTYRVLYVARFADAVYVLHAFQKKLRATPRTALELARQRYAELLRYRRQNAS